MQKAGGKVLRIVAIIFMGMTATMNILGGIGTVCAAFLTRNFESLSEFYDYRLLYQGLMIATIMVGIAGVWVTVRLIKGGPRAFRNAIIILLVGTALGATQYFASLSITNGEGGTPANVKFYINALTLVLFLILALTPIRKWVDFSSSMGRGEITAASGLTAFVAGVITLTVYAWVGPSHIDQGTNWIDVLREPLIASGSLLTIAGCITMLWPALAPLRNRQLKSRRESV